METSKSIASRIRAIVLPLLAKGEEERIRERLDTVTENIYQRLPSGDYGRGDVRAAILAALEEHGSPRVAEFGSISHGTLVTADLLQAFSDTLEELDEPRAIALCEEYDASDPDQSWDAYVEADDERAVYLLEALSQALEEHAPPYGYFGSHCGDGSDFGFWPVDEINEFVVENGGLVVSDTAEVPDDFSGEVLHVSDHGNLTLYNAADGALVEVWSIV